MQHVSAFLVDAGTPWSPRLIEVITAVGFAGVHRFESVEDIEKQIVHTPICFVLFPPVDNLARLEGAIAAVRSHPSRRIRFQPLICFTDTPSLERVRAAINLGFDDVVAKPYTLNGLVPRIRQQLDRTLIYFETASYFGPDRRDRGMGGALRDGSGGQYRRIEISREQETGIAVISDEMIENGMPAIYL